MDEYLLSIIEKLKNISKECIFYEHKNMFDQLIEINILTKDTLEIEKILLDSHFILYSSKDSNTYSLKSERKIICEFCNYIQPIYGCKVHGRNCINCKKVIYNEYVVGKYLTFEFDNKNYFSVEKLEMKILDYNYETKILTLEKDLSNERQINLLKKYSNQYRDLGDKVQVYVHEKRKKHKKNYTKIWNKSFEKKEVNYTELYYYPDLNVYCEDKINNKVSVSFKINLFKYDGHESFDKIFLNNFAPSLVVTSPYISNPKNIESQRSNIQKYRDIYMNEKLKYANTSKYIGKNLENYI